MQIMEPNKVWETGKHKMTQYLQFRVLGVIPLY